MVHTEQGAYVEHCYNPLFISPPHLLSFSPQADPAPAPAPAAAKTASAPPARRVSGDLGLCLWLWLCLGGNPELALRAGLASRGLSTPSLGLLHCPELLGPVQPFSPGSQTPEEPILSQGSKTNGPVGQGADSQPGLLTGGTDALL